MVLKLKSAIAKKIAMMDNQDLGQETVNVAKGATSL